VFSSILDAHTWTRMKSLRL